MTNKLWNSTFQTLFAQDFPGLTIIYIDKKEDLLSLQETTLANSRLISFFTDIIVPKHILDSVGFGCYNFHPSTPNRRGWAPLNYALLEGDLTSGTTLSLMVDRVDSGPIIGFDSFDILETDDYFSTNQKIFLSAFKLFHNFRKRLFLNSNQLFPLPISWGRHFKTQSDLFIDTLIDITSVDQLQLMRLVKAFGFSPELCLLRFKEGNDCYYFDMARQRLGFEPDKNIFGYKFYRLKKETIPFQLKDSPLFYNALLNSL